MIFENTLNSLFNVMLFFGCLWVFSVFMQEYFKSVNQEKRRKAIEQEEKNHANK